MGQSKNNEHAPFGISPELELSVPEEDNTNHENSSSVISSFSEISRNDIDEIDECPRCGFVKQRHESGDHVTMPDVVKDCENKLKKSSKIPLKGDSKKSCARKSDSRRKSSSSNPFVLSDSNTAHKRTDFEKVKQMNAISSDISVSPGMNSSIKRLSKNMYYNDKSYNKSKPRCKSDGASMEKQIPMTLLNGNTMENNNESQFTEEHSGNVIISGDISSLKPTAPSPVGRTTMQPSFPFDSHNIMTNCQSLSGNKTTELRREFPEIIDEYSRVTGYDSNLDLVHIDKAFQWLRPSGFYYGKLTMPEARRKLKKSSIGTFLLRDSSDPRYFLSLSVKTQRGTTSIRISYNRGRFRLDCEDTAFLKMPSFDCIMKLIQHYTDVTSKDTNHNNCVFLESSGRKDTPVLLKKPYLENALSLKHLCRSNLNRLLTPEQSRRLLLFMPPSIEQYMGENPYFV